jgi:hypothetical protein
MYPNSLFEKYRSKGVLIDTNLLLMVAVGNYSASRILSWKRTQQYTLDDYALMLRILEYFPRRVTSPNILTEVDNIARQLPEFEHEAISVALFQLIASSFEVYAASAIVTQTPIYPAIGLTDCVTMSLADEALVLTDDFELSNRLANSGRDALNINHIRHFSL